MSDQQPLIPEYIPPPTGKTFVDMSVSEKGTFIGKAFVMMITGGFAFPNVWIE